MSNVKSPIGPVSGVRSEKIDIAETAKSLFSEDDFKDFPKIDVIQLVKLITEVSQRKKNPQEAAEEFGAPYMAFAKVFAARKKTELQELAKSTAKDYINEAVTYFGMEELAETDFDERLIACTMSTASLVKQYMNRQIPVEEFIEKLGNGEIKNMTSEVLRASGMDVQLAEKLGVENLSELSTLGSSTVAFAAFTAAYQMIREAQEDLEVAKAHRAEIEAACSESIALIRQYRQEMETVVNKYLSDRIMTFESGFKAMDKAILENDMDGYIRGNVEIQKILGYDVQFTNQEEFDDLMDSDIAFKL